MIEQLTDVLKSGLVFRSNILPSDFIESRRVMPNGAAFPGKFSYDRTPYLREIVNRLAQGDPAKIISVMKGAQIGFSTGVIEAAIAWIISENPGHILFLTGHSDLSVESMNKIDQVIDDCGLRHLIKPNVLRARNSRTGDTNKSKEFPDGSLISGSATNHKLLRQRSVQYGFIDDFAAAKAAAKESGATSSMIEQRFAAYFSKMKLYYISTPELKAGSPILEVYLKGDQRMYQIPCQRCGAFQHLEWSVDIEGTDGKEKAGITWKLDARDRLIKSSVGYICKHCGGYFDERNKAQFLLDGFWKPTVEPKFEDHTSYHLPSLYAPPGMYNWTHYVEQYLQANPPNEPQKEDQQKTFINLCMGWPFEPTSTKLDSRMLMRNIRDYEIGVIPEAVSIRDGNGKILLLTCAADLNGKVDDARLDYEIVAWSESGASYSIKHGSIGTFVPRENTAKNKTDRERWTYEENKPNSVWPKFEEAINEIFVTDTGRRMKVFATGVDCGHYTSFAYNFIDKTNTFVVGLKGKDADKAIRFGIDTPTFRVAKERPNLYLAEVSMIKDDLSEYMQLKWDARNDEKQPTNFMNFPQPGNGLYDMQKYFAHFESEVRTNDLDKDGVPVAARWVKKDSAVQNHFWDVRVYNMVMRDIIVHLFAQEYKLKKLTWKEYVDLILGSIKH